MIPMIDRSFCCSFTGHRPAKLPWHFDEQDERCVKLKEKIYDVSEAVYFAGICHYLCGMAQGCDMYFCEAVIRLRDRHPEITLEAAIPCLTQARAFSEEERNRYQKLLDSCDQKTVLQEAYTPDCMLKRNKYMVDSSSILIAAYSGTTGGTMHTLNYAKKKGIETIEIII